MLTRFLLSCTLAISGLLAADTKPPAKKPEAHIVRLHKYLTADGLGAKIDEDGDITIVATLASGRKQKTFIDHELTEVEGTKYFQIWSPAVGQDGPLSADVMREALIKANEHVLPSWKLMVSSSGRNMLCAYCWLPLDVDKDRFLAAVGITMGVADRLEAKASKEDRY